MTCFLTVIHGWLFDLFRALDRHSLRYPPGPDWTDVGYGLPGEPCMSEYSSRGRLWERHRVTSAWDCDPRSGSSERTPHTFTSSGEFHWTEEVYFGLKPNGAPVISWDRYGGDGPADYFRVRVNGRTPGDWLRHARLWARFRVLRALYGFAFDDAVLWDMAGSKTLVRWAVRGWPTFRRKLRARTA